jgi:hypothetical protein
MVDAQNPFKPLFAKFLHEGMRRNIRAIVMSLTNDSFRDFNMALITIQPTLSL